MECMIETFLGSLSYKKKEKSQTFTLNSTVSLTDPHN